MSSMPLNTVTPSPQNYDGLRASEFQQSRASGNKVVQGLNTLGKGATNFVKAIYKKVAKYNPIDPIIPDDKVD